MLEEGWISVDMTDTTKWYPQSGGEGVRLTGMWHGKWVVELQSARMAGSLHGTHVKSHGQPGEECTAAVNMASAVEELPSGLGTWEQGVSWEELVRNDDGNKLKA